MIPAALSKRIVLPGCDSAFVRLNQPGNAIQQRGLPCPRRAKQDRDPRRHGDGEVEFEILSRALANLHGDFFRFRRSRVLQIAYGWLTQT